MSIYQNYYIAKAKRFEIAIEERDELIALQIDTYDKLSLVVTEQQARAISKLLSEYLAKRTAGATAAKGPRADDPDDEFV